MDRGELSNSTEEVEAETDPGQGSSFKEIEAPIDNLPPEMLTLILKYLDTRSLVKCRLVSCQWSLISTAIFRNRLPPIPFWFLWEDETFSHNNGRILKEFVQCAKTSPPENCPFTYFWFSTYGSTCFDHEDFREFLSVFSTRRLKYINLDLAYYAVEFPGLVEKLRRFLLSDVPQLEELHLNLDLDWIFLERERERVDYKKVPLFPTTVNSNKDGPPLPVQFQLPNLKWLRLDPWTISPHLQISKDLLNAAVNLTWIQMWTQSPEDFEFLRSLEKLHLLQSTTIMIDERFVEDLKNKEFQNWSLPVPVNSLSPLPLEILSVGKNMRVSQFDEMARTKVSNFLLFLFQSSKDSLKEMEMEAFGFLAHLQLPVFRKLRTLKLRAPMEHQLFPSGTRTRDIFPAVDSLELNVENWPQAFPQQDSIPRLPSVKTLVVNEWNFKAEQAAIAVSILAQLCPNLKKLVVQKSEEDWESPKFNLLKVGRSIWTHMTELECLEVDLNLVKPEHDAHDSVALDSCFSGVSIENCSQKQFLRFTEAKQGFEENGIPVEIPQTKLKVKGPHTNSRGS